MSREQPVEPAPDLRSIGISYKCEDGWHIFMAPSEPGLYVMSKDFRKACDDVLPSLKLLHELDAQAAPIEVLVPRPEPQTREVDEEQMRRLHENGAVAWAMQRPVGDDLKDKFHSALGRYWDCAYKEGKEGREHDDSEGRAQQTLGELLDIFDAAWNGPAAASAVGHVGKGESGVEPRPQDRQEGR